MSTVWEITLCMTKETRSQKEKIGVFGLILNLKNGVIAEQISFKHFLENTETVYVCMLFSCLVMCQIFMLNILQDR